MSKYAWLCSTGTVDVASSGASDRPSAVNAAASGAGSCARNAVRPAVTNAGSNTTPGCGPESAATNHELNIVPPRNQSSMQSGTMFAGTTHAIVGNVSGGRPGTASGRPDNAAAI